MPRFLEEEPGERSVRVSGLRDQLAGLEIWQNYTLTVAAYTRAGIGVRYDRLDVFLASFSLLFFT